ncbi:MAG: toll/interleukin-1 receptor domain-containing protein [Pseudomonadota bacterium]
MKTQVFDAREIKRRFGQTSVQKAENNLNTTRSLNESAALRLERLDIFLCHAMIVKKLVDAFLKMLESMGFKVCVDWIIDKNSRNKKISGDNADLLKRRMKQCDRLVYLCTPNSSDSKWCPWEIGIFDQMKSKVFVAVASDSSDFAIGQEYLELYPRLFAEDGFLNRSRMRYETDTTYKVF